MASVLEGRTVYSFKREPYSSHTLLLDAIDGPGKGRRVLDLGCAGGYISEALAARGFSVTGVDLPGAEHSPDIEFIAANLDEGLPALVGRFDYIVCADILEHLRDPQQLLEAARQRLAPGGRLVASLPNSGHAWFRWQVLRGRFPQEDRGLFDRTHVRFYVYDGWIDLLRRSGFTVEREAASGVPVGMQFPRWRGTAPVRAAEWMSFQSARVWKRMFAFQFIVRARPERQDSD
jgi:SAM-dependent methyltransferase